MVGQNLSNQFVKKATLKENSFQFRFYISVMIECVCKVYDKIWSKVRHMNEFFSSNNKTVISCFIEL